MGITIGGLWHGRQEIKKRANDLNHEGLNLEGLNLEFGLSFAILVRPLLIWKALASYPSANQQTHFLSTEPPSELTMTEEQTMDQDLSPAEALRKRLTEGRARFWVLLATTMVWVMDSSLLNHIEKNHVVAGSYSAVLGRLEVVSSLVFVVVTLGLAQALFSSSINRLFHWALVYLVVSMVQVVANVLSMVATASSIRGGGLSGLWDVAGVYMQSVVVFTFIYIFLDISTPGGAFVWPSRNGDKPPTPHVIDYLFISLNVNSTYGPTTEAVMSRPAKMFMALQVLLAIMMLTVLIARAVSA